MFSSCYRCLNPYMFFPLQSGAKGRFCDLFLRNRKLNSLGVFAAFVLRGFLVGGGVVCLGFFLSSGRGQRIVLG